MSEHSATVTWNRSVHPEKASTYSRNHQVRLNGDQTVNVSASLEFMGDGACADPEQMLVSAVASCHMLTFLAIADFHGFRVQSYVDDARGYLEKSEGSGLRITRIQLAPQIEFGGDRTPDAAALDRLHASAHKNCFIANSITAHVVVAGHPEAGEVRGTR
jgi:organic hydroperoxide reductase OsmC/OhrA